MCVCVCVCVCSAHASTASGMIELALYSTIQLKIVEYRLYSLTGRLCQCPHRDGVVVLQLEVLLSSASRPCLGLLWDGGNSRPTRIMYFASCGFELCLNLEPTMPLRLPLAVAA
jgi:hypothetical protein